MYYALIMISVVMFGGCFALDDAYRKLRGSGLKVSMEYSAISALAGFAVLLVLNGFRMEFSVFTLIMAVLASVNGFAFTFCALKALGCTNLSVYSLFSMLGGMVLPFVQGIAFYREPVTLAKVLCFVCIAAALFLSVEKGEKAKGTVYYIGVFVLNGMSGVLAKLFTEAPYAKTSAAGLTLLSCACTFIIAAMFLLFMRGKAMGKPGVKSVTVTSLSGIINKIANVILVMALAHVDASVQYPMVTGGVMIVSTVICFFGRNKPGKKDILSVTVAFIGLLMLFAVPI